MSLREGTPPWAGHSQALSKDIFAYRYLPKRREFIGFGPKQ